MKRLLALSIALGFISTMALGQDTLILKKNPKVKLYIKVVELTWDAIHYKQVPNTRGPTYTIAREKVLEIRYGPKMKTKRKAKAKRAINPNLSPRAQYSFGLGVGVLVIPAYSVSANYFLNPSIHLEGGFGLGLGSSSGGSSWNITLGSVWYVGARYHFYGKSLSGFTPYAGSYYARNRNMDVYEHEVHLPVGIQYITEQGGYIGLESGLRTIFSNPIRFSPWFSVKTGGYFLKSY